MKTVREAYGLTQEQLAGYLGITRSQLSVAESENRGMNATAINKCTQLLQLLKLKKTPSQLTDANNQQLQELRQKLTARSTYAEQKAQQLRYKLQTMQAQHQQCRHALLAVEQLLPQLPTGKEGKKDKLWLEILEADTLDKLKHCGPMAQQLLELEIGLLEDEVLRIGEVL